SGPATPARTPATFSPTRRSASPPATSASATAAAPTRRTSTTSSSHRIRKCKASTARSCRSWSTCTSWEGKFWNCGTATSILRLKMEVVTRFFRFPSGSAFIFGPRGSGKSTWLRHSLPDALWVNLLQPGTYREMSARPERLRELVEGSSQRDVVIDEIQRVPELLNVVHDVMESGEKRRFLLTGSSARKLRRGGVDLLAGRALNLTMHPFMAAEVPAFDLDSSLEIGMLPLVVGSADPVATLHAYATLYLDEEVKLEGWARDIGRFARFLETVTFSHGSVLNVANV